MRHCLIHIILILLLWPCVALNYGWVHFYPLFHYHGYLSRFCCWPYAVLSGCIVFTMLAVGAVKIGPAPYSGAGLYIFNFLCYCIFVFLANFSCRCFRFSLFSTRPRDCLGRMSVLCCVGRKTTTQCHSIVVNLFVCQVNVIFISDSSSAVMI